MRSASECVGLLRHCRCDRRTHSDTERTCRAVGPTQFTSPDTTDTDRTVLSCELCVTGGQRVERDGVGVSQVAKRRLSERYAEVLGDSAASVRRVHHATAYRSVARLHRDTLCTHQPTTIITRITVLSTVLHEQARRRTHGGTLSILNRFSKFFLRTTQQ